MNRTKIVMIVISSLVLLVFTLRWSVGPVAAKQGRGQRVRPSNSNRVALVIGNGTYASSPLANPVNDARDMAQALRELGFEVTELLDQQRRDMRAAIRAFGEKLKSGGVGLFYYAGHGMQVNGKNYLIPIGADAIIEAEVEDEAVDVGLVLKHMAEAGNRPNIVILDACRNNPFARSFRSSSRGLASIDAPVGTLLAYATAPGMVASDGKGRNGLYTAELLKQIPVRDLKIEDVFKRVRAAVEAKTNGTQIPWESVSITEDFYFAGTANPPPTITRIRPTPTPTPIMTKPTPRPARKSAESNFIRFDLLSCRASGQVIVCDFTVTNTDTKDRELQIYTHRDVSDSTRAWDNFGNTYMAQEVILANQRGGGMLTLGTSPKLRITFETAAGTAQHSTKLSKLEIYATTRESAFRVSFRDICLGENCPESSTNEPSTTGQRNYAADNSERTFGNSERTFTVPANRQWFDTGIDVEPGMRLEANASGTISLGEGRSSDPNGAPGVGAANLFFPVKMAFMGALIAKVRYPNGKESKKVVLGVRTTILIENNESGRLFLGINDSPVSDNQGAYTVTIRW